MFLSASRLQGTRHTEPNDPFITSVNLLMHLDGSNNGTSFLDQCGNTITLQGSPVTSTAQFKFGTASLSLNGSSALKVADSARIVPGTGDFTIEAWIRPTATANARIWSYQAAGSAQVMILGRDATGRVFGELRDSSGANDTTLTGATVLNLNQWYHIAFVRQGTTCYIFVDGVMEGNLGGMSQNIPTGGVCSIGYFQTGANAFFTGFIDEIRFTKGVARYTANFTPPSAAFQDTVPDPYFGSVINLLHFDGANGATTTTDVTGKSIVLSNSTISTAQFRFGGSSLNVTGGSTSYAQMTTEALGNGSFTIEYWVRFNALATSPNGSTMFDGRPVTTAGAYPTIYADTADFHFYTGSGDVMAGGTPAINTWFHVAICRSGSTIRLFIDGVQVASATDTTNYLLAGTGIALLGGNTASGAQNMNGYLDDVRITKGVARYTANFTPPNLAFANA